MQTGLKVNGACVPQGPCLSTPLARELRATTLAGEKDRVRHFW
jgi:hypothetical protein